MIDPAGQESGWAPARAAARARLEAFAPRAGRYGAERNFDRPGHPDVSRLSPWLRCRALTEAEVVAAVRQRYAASTVEKFVQEVLWRTYWKGWLESRPNLWPAYLRRVDELRARADGAVWGETYRRALEARTGLGCADAWLRELIDTGYLHNHARMWLASVWIFTWRLPWELGADLFLRHLLDGDPASNTLGWRWVAGLHTAGKTYLARADNIAHYTEGRLRPAAGELATQAFAVPETTEPGPLRRSMRPLPASDPGGPECGLWLHEEDLAPEVAGWADARVAVVYAGRPAEAAVAGEAPAVASFRTALLRDGLERAARHYGAPAGWVEAGAGRSWAQTLAAAAAAAGLRRVVFAEPAEGPWRPVALAVADALRAHGLEPVPLRREWDAVLWPLATRGFFTFWQAAAGRLEELTGR